MLSSKLRCIPKRVVLSASFCAKDLPKAAWCQYLEILRAKRRAQDDVDLELGIGDWGFLSIARINEA
ncbi:hypothetical protein Lsha_1673 [Legionella shakespearei DSM 23087]|uniref:Uncharacterized protein n=1 Tax=Legionella shakespearei DSM 23087 TaxID=1122169 RepID=A0A0W0YTQ7_9GAMM|nr:hypothetical protein Lsha_1673 [Legionella shakespearei DSM 23087]